MSYCHVACRQVLAAAAAAPTAPRELTRLPRHLIMDGVCVYAGNASDQQLRQAAATRRKVADASIIGGGGLQSAVLQLHYENARS